VLSLQTPSPAFSFFDFPWSPSIRSGTGSDDSKDSDYLAFREGRTFMNITFKRLGMLALLGWCLKTQAVCAQAPVAAQPPQAPQNQVPMVVTDGGAVATEAPRPGPLKRFLNSYGLGCHSSHNDYGCGSFWSEFAFVFGSCRSFFGEESCTHSPRHFGTGSDGAQKCGCGN
jgi:hypothetical protein